MAVFLIVEMLFNTVAPTVSWALTAGPTAPEATSFEPVDTTDIVDLKTGDFTYNIPLLEVPGPAGGYPFSLSYHAGIQPDQEASSTGLGFVLNTGSVTRMVNGYPDDHNNVTNIDRAYWEGGEQVTSTVGVSVGIANVATVSAGLSFAQDTYKGYGQGMYLGVGVGTNISKVANLSASITAGTSPYGNSYVSAGVNIGISAGSQEAHNASSSIGLSFNSNSGLEANASTGIGVGRGSLLDASISTNSSGRSLAIGGGVSGVYNGKSGKVSYNSDNFQIDIPVYYGLNLRLGRDYQRYWIDETASANTFGSLYLAGADPNFVTAFDTYDLLDLSLDVAKYDNPEKVLGGSFPDTDFYTVTAQGLSGNIKPYHFRQNLYREDKKDVSEKILTKSYKLSNQSLNTPVEFRFINDFSNRFEYTPNDFINNSGVVSFNFDDEFITGENGAGGYSDNHLAGSKHIEWYTNQEILRANPNVNPFDEGFIDCVADGFNRSSDLQIGGFSITNASGVTYHYALPAYSYAEYMKSVNSSTKQEEDGMTFNELKKPEKYAYTWFLTALTGPDFVDRNSNGLADHGDWGYWVNFEYKKHLSDYKWRNPGEGANKDLDGEFENYSAGKKEIYYLDKIVTQSHIAVFEKSLRYDGREVTDMYDGGFEPLPIIDPACIDQCRIDCEESYCDQGNCVEPARTQCVDGCATACSDEVIGYNFPRASLKLDKIKLYNYDDFIASKIGAEYVLRSVNFEYDYSLAQGTPNSYSEENFNAKLGKLTLKTLKFGGKGNVSLIPPMLFHYKNIPYQKDKVDVWGFYKNDFSADYKDRTNEMIGRATTSGSALDADAWSLNEVETSLGASVKIEYESDQYQDVVLANRQTLRVKDVIDYEEDKFKLTFWEEDFDLLEYFQIGQTIEIDLIGAFQNNLITNRECNCSFNGEYPINFNIRSFNGNVSVDNIDSENNFIIVSSDQYYDKVKYETKVFKDLIPVNTECEENDILVCSITYAGQYAMPRYFSAGIVSIPERPRYGGGLRVKSIQLTNQLGSDRKTGYEYENGITSYEPYEILSPKIHPTYLAVGIDPRQSKLEYKRAMLRKFYKEISISRQIPGPGVMYKAVTTKEWNISSDGVAHQLPNFSRYEFETYEAGMISIVNEGTNVAQSADNQYEDVQYNNSYLNKIALKDFSSRVGNLKKITLYSSEGGSVVPISETVNEYLHDGLDGSFEANVNQYEPALLNGYTNQGVTEETFTRSRIQLFEKMEYKPYMASGEADDFFGKEERHLLATISKHEVFPAIPIGQNNYNYKTGIRTSTKNLAFDFYSGEVTQVLTSDSYGSKYLSVTVPAYKNYPGMGSKVGSKTNRNMLTQSSEQYSYVVDNDNVPTGLLSASIQTWSDQVPVLNLSGPQTNIWRPLASYLWSGTEPLNNDGTYPYSDFNSHRFSMANHSANDRWDKTSELTLYDVYSHGLEVKDINNNFASTRMNKDQDRVIASGTNVRYSEMANSGAEYYSGNTENEGGVSRDEGNPSRAHVHTGEFSLLVGTGTGGFNYTLNAAKTDLSKKYRASVWVYAPGEAETQQELNKVELYYIVNGREKGVVHPVLQKNKSKSWYLLNLDVIPDGSNDIFIGVRNNAQRGVYFDDFRVHPLNASLTSYVYDPFSGELNYILDANNFYTRFEYNAMGQLIRTTKELLNFDFGEGKESFRADAVLKEFQYNYGKGNE